jgi:hypothetical protein
MSTKTKASNQFKVWDWVSFPYGVRDMLAQIIELRGPLGTNGRQIYRIRIVPDEGEPDEFELPEEALQAASAPEKGAIIDYLKQGGLVEILRSNLVGGRNQPKVWLTYTQRGNITHTLVPERGIVGGRVVPYFALYEDKVFAGKEKAVADFLQSFGLSRKDAEQVIAAIGTGP